MGTPTPLGAPEGAPAPTLEPHAAPVAAHAAPAPRAADEEALLAMFRDSQGASPEERITRMEQFVRAFPSSPLAAGIARDIEALRVAAEGASVPAAPTAEQQRQLIQRAVRARVYALALTEAHADQPVFIGLLLEPSMGELQPAERGVPAQPPASRGMSDLDAVSGFEPLRAEHRARCAGRVHSGVHAHRRHRSHACAGAGRASYTPLASSSSSSRCPA